MQSFARPFAVGIFGCAALVGCSDVVNPDNKVLPSSGGLENLTIRMPSDIAAIGCAVVAREASGGVWTAVVPRSAVAPILGTLDQAPAQLTKGRLTPKSLQVVSATFQPPAESRTYTVNCLASRAKSYGDIAFLLRSSESSPVWQAVRAQLRDYSANAGQRDVRLASSLLLARLHEGVQPVRLRIDKQAGRFAPSQPIKAQFALTTSEARPLGSSLQLVRGGNRSQLSVPTGVSRTYDCGTEAAIPCDPYTLPTVTVTGHPGGGYPIIIDWSDVEDWLQQSPNLSDLLFQYYYAQECENLNETWTALSEQLSELDQQINDMQVATNYVSGEGCDYTLTRAGATYCLDLFIMTERAGFLVGDDRRFDRYAPYTASRAQIYFNPSECAAYWVVNTTRAIIDYKNWDNDTITVEPAKLSWVQAYRGLNGNCRIKWKLWSGWCKNQQVGGWYLACPAIDGSIELTPLSNGNFSATLSEDPYPSRGLYQWTGSDWNTISERTQGIWLDLFMARQRKERLQLERDALRTDNCSPM